MQQKNTTQFNDDFDTPWKEVLEIYFKDFLLFFFPEAADGIDWHAGYKFLDKELQQVSKDSELGRRYADKLVQVYRIDGEEVWVLIHVEIQAQQDTNFAKRMYTYNYRIFDHYNRPVVSLAILADPQPAWRPNKFSWELWGCQVGIQFPMIKLLDYADKWPELESNNNPFATCTMAHLKTMETKGDVAARRRWKVILARRLYDQGKDKKYILNLFRFIDWIMNLPDDQEKSFWEEIQNIEKEKTMPYVTSVERLGIQKGRMEGEKEGARQLFKRQLTIKFGSISENITAQLDNADEETILKWSERILTANSLGDIFGH